MTQKKFTSFKEIQTTRQKLADAHSENDTNLDIFTVLYSDISHFVYEILQNAEDKKATSVSFFLCEDKLEIEHNGIDFSLDDVAGITNIGRSTKVDDWEKIGKFGIGFKSVYAITQSPIIYSGEFHFKIQDRVVPIEVEPLVINGTRIILPFDHPERNEKEAYKLVKERITNLKLNTLLFLKNIGRVDWLIANEKGSYTREENEQRTMRLTSSNGEAEKYLLFRKGIKIKEFDLEVEIAYQLGDTEDGHEQIVSINGAQLFAFFATNKDTYLKFLIQGPYKTTPARDNIPLEDEVNKRIIAETANLVAESLEVLRDTGLITVDFLHSVLPTNKNEKSPIYSAIYSQVLEKFKTSRLLPNHEGKFVLANESMLARGKDLIEFLTAEDLLHLFEKSAWLHPNIKTDSELGEYLRREIGIKQIDFDDFLDKITADFLSTKSDEWMINFYVNLNNQRSSFARIKTKPIIRTNGNSHTAPFKADGKTPQVYLPIETDTAYPTVKTNLAEDENCLKFFKEIGLRKPSLLDEVNEFVFPKYVGETHISLDEKYYSDLEKVMRVFSSLTNQEEKSRFKELPFIASYNPTTEAKKISRAKEIYLCDSNLMNYFEGNAQVYFVDSELYKHFKKEDLEKFLRGVEVEDKPRRLPDSSSRLSYEEKRELRGAGGHTYDVSEKDYTIDGLNFALEKNITLNKSQLIWEQLVKILQDVPSSKINDFFEGVYVWKYNGNWSRNFDAGFIKKLRASRWIYTMQGDVRSPSEISLTDIADIYEKENQAAKVLVGKLKFKPEPLHLLIQQLSDDDKKMYEEFQNLKNVGLSSQEIINAIQEIKQRLREDHRDKDWSSDIDATKAKIVVEDFAPSNNTNESKFKEEQPIEDPEWIDAPRDSQKEGEPKFRDGPKLDTRKDIGRWGEEYVLHVLKEEYAREGLEDTALGFKIELADEVIEIEWLNANRDHGRGYDLSIKVNGKAEKYIEVKTKKDEEPTAIQLSRTQWKYAHRHRDSYWLYVVSSAGTNSCKVKKIQNPVGKWEAGELEIETISLKL
ncbi:MAG: DUF3883 domain-containing protein [Candidatus Omnitrophica bacterium]|nr:DUF3883 domain-containing protein [Candidatus Omnitrophota bacterium]